MFPAGIYSCSDAVAIGNDPITDSVAYDAAVQECRRRQDIGTVIAGVHFLPPIVLGTITNQALLRIFNLDGLAWGGVTFWLGALPGLLLELSIISAIIHRGLYSLSNRLR